MNFLAVRKKVGIVGGYWAEYPGKCGMNGEKQERQEKAKTKKTFEEIEKHEKWGWKNELGIIR